MSRKLVRINALAGPESFHDSNGNGAIYVLGGAQESLEGRYRTAAALYRAGAAKKMLIYSREGITAYNPGAQRPLTNDEWSIMRLTGLGVRRDDIELIQVKKFLLGTYSEAKDVSRLASERHYNFLILVSSQYHTMRVWVIFSKFMDRNIGLHVYAAHADGGLKGLMKEYIKLAVYRCLAII
ncbi:MAG: ElyC/SanA/YdcF family protein [Deltaproteobacteria bacterium]